MKWLKNLFKKTETEIKQTRKINFNEVEAILLEELKDKTPEIKEKVEQFRTNFIKYLELLNKDFDELKDSKFEAVVLEDKRDISNIVLTSRNNYCLGSKKVICNTIESLKRDISLEKMKTGVLEVFSRLNSLSRESQILLHSFQPVMKKISIDLKKIKNEMDNFESFLDEDYSIVNMEKKAKEQVDSIRKNRENKERKESGKKEIEEKIKNKGKEIQAQKSEILKIKNSAEAFKVKKLEKEQILLKKQIESIIFEITSLVNDIGRQVKKYLHTKEIDKHEKSKVLNFLKNPENLLKEDYTIFKKIIKEVKKNLEAIESDEKKRKKFNEIKNRIISSLDDNVAEYRKILKKQEENYEKLNDFRQEINAEKLEYELEKLNIQMKELEEDKKEMERESEYNEKEELKKLEIILSDIFDAEVKIK